MRGQTMNAAPAIRLCSRGFIPRSSLFRSLFALVLVASLFISRAAFAFPKDSDAKSPDPMLAAKAAIAGDPLLEALLTELERSKAQLKMDQLQAPYFLEYRVSDVEDFTTEAAFGATREDQHIHVRILRVVVRLGDYKQDSYFGAGIGGNALLPLDNDPIALRHQIWLATDEAYKNASQALTQKESILKQFSKDENPVDDFAKASPVQIVEPAVSLKVDEGSWKKTLETVTDLYRQYPDVQSVSASARFTVVNDYLLNSEGTVTRNGRAVYTVQFNASTQAPDGMRLGRSPAWTVANPGELPTRDKLLADSKSALETLQALRQAPIVDEEYRGPVLFSPDAADDVVASLIGSNVLGRKPQLGAPNRTTGAFATSFKSRVLPTFVNIVDNPTLKDFQGKSLIGSYDVDSEGIKSRSVDIVDKGVLTNYLVGRQPIRDFPESNGHGRASTAQSRRLAHEELRGAIARCAQKTRHRAGHQRRPALRLSRRNHGRFRSAPALSRVR